MPTQWEPRANEHTLGTAPSEPGKPIDELERELGIHDAIKLASNENPLPPSGRVQRAILTAVNHLNRYPDGSGFYLRQALAKKHRGSPHPGVVGKRSERADRPARRPFPPPRRRAGRPPPALPRLPQD